MYTAKDSEVLYRQLKVQKICIDFLFSPGSLPVGSPNLASAASYAALGASAVTNTGSSVLTGNLGLYPGTSVTGFPPGVFTGVENVANGAANQAQMDALTAYTSALSQTPTPISSTLDGQTLVPGVYSESSGTFNLATAGAGTLTLNGAGVYIFQASSTLTTGAGGTPTITLENGATAGNVYWIVGTSATINSGHTGVFQGNVIAHTSITDTSGGTVNGSLIALNGAITFSAAAIVNVSPASRTAPTLTSDEESIVFFQTQTVDQVTPELAVGEIATYTPNDLTGLVNILVAISEQVTKVIAATITNRRAPAAPPVVPLAYLGSATGITTQTVPPVYPATGPGGSKIMLTGLTGVDNATTVVDAMLEVYYVTAE